MALVTIDMMITSLADVAPMIAFLEHVASNSTTIRKYKKRVGTSSQRSPHCDTYRLTFAFIVCCFASIVGYFAAIVGST